MRIFSTAPTPPKISSRSSTKRHSRRERDDDYKGTLIYITSRWRIIVCKDGIQWIVQKRSVEHPNTGTWAGKSYCTTRDSLIAACSRRNLLSDASVRQALDALPTNIRDYAFERSGS